MKDRARYWIEALGLEPHQEGGYFRESYRASETLGAKALPERYHGDRSTATAIYYLLHDREVSVFHRLKSDEVWHFYDGIPVILHVLAAGGCYARHLLGCDPAQGERPQRTVPAGAWFAAELANPGGYALMGCTVAPGFAFSDFELADRTELCRGYPEQRRLIERLSR